MATKKRSNSEYSTSQVELEQIRDAYMRRTGGRQYLGDETRTPYVADVVMELMALRAETLPDTPISEYVAMYHDAVKFLFRTER